MKYIILSLILSAVGVGCAAAVPNTEARGFFDSLNCGPRVSGQWAVVEVSPEKGTAGHVHIRRLFRAPEDLQAGDARPGQMSFSYSRESRLQVHGTSSKKELQKNWDQISSFKCGRGSLMLSDSLEARISAAVATGKLPHTEDDPKEHAHYVSILHFSILRNGEGFYDGFVGAVTERSMNAEIAALLVAFADPNSSESLEAKKNYSGETDEKIDAWIKILGDLVLPTNLSRDPEILAPTSHNGKIHGRG